MMKLPFLIPVHQRVRRGWKRTCSKIWAFPFGACFVKRRCGRVSETRYAPLSASEVLALLSVIMRYKAEIWVVPRRALASRPSCVGGVLFFLPSKKSIK